MSFSPRWKRKLHNPKLQIKLSFCLFLHTFLCKVRTRNIFSSHFSFYWGRILLVLTQPRPKKWLRISERCLTRRQGGSGLLSGQKHGSSLQGFEFIFWVRAHVLGSSSLCYLGSSACYCRVRVLSCWLKSWVRVLFCGVRILSSGFESCVRVYILLVESRVRILKVRALPHRFESVKSCLGVVCVMDAWENKEKVSQCQLSR